MANCPECGKPVSPPYPGERACCACGWSEGRDVWCARDGVYVSEDDCAECAKEECER